VLCVYADVDRLIDGASLTQAERRVAEQVMRGYGITDIGDHYGCTAQTINTLFRRAVVKICRRNDREWEKTYAVGGKT